ncbi:MAG TPA: hypothetical protein VNC42_00500 [Bradyrhizobium sp.]|jgi:hypothetical protein|nr:hypothetical protein [Bradyrhizobium sp.]
MARPRGRGVRKIWCHNVFLRDFDRPVPAIKIQAAHDLSEAEKTHSYKTIVPGRAA